MLKIRRSHDRLIFNMGISIPGKDGLCIETGPCFPPSLISSLVSETHEPSQNVLFLFLLLFIYWSTYSCASICCVLFLTRPGGIKFNILTLGVMDFYYWGWTLPVVIQHNANASCYVIISAPVREHVKGNSGACAMCDWLCNMKQRVYFEFQFQFQFEYGSTNTHLCKYHHWLWSISMVLTCGLLPITCHGVWYSQLETFFIS